MTILNLTQHESTAEQRAAGVVDLDATPRAALAKLLTFDTLSGAQDLTVRAGAVADLARHMEASVAMIGGAPFFMAPLERALVARGIRPVCAFSVRESAEERQPDGTVRKVAVFRHRGFVEVA
jgi:hypothetical protein